MNRERRGRVENREKKGREKSNKIRNFKFLNLEQ